MRCHVFDTEQEIERQIAALAGGLDICSCGRFLPSASGCTPPQEPACVSVHVLHQLLLWSVWLPHNLLPAVC